MQFKFQLQDIYQQTLKSLANEVAAFIGENEKGSDNDNTLLISFDKEIVVGDIRQFIKTEFHGKKRSFLYPKFIPKEQPNIILESVANEFASGDGGLAVDPNLADAIYQEFLLINMKCQIQLQ